MIQKPLTKAIKKAMPALRSTDGQNDDADDAIAYVKFFTGGYTGFFTELDPNTGELFGKVYIHGVGFEPEWGYSSLDEISSVKSMERDLYFTPTRIGDCKFAGFNEPKRK